MELTLQPLRRMFMRAGAKRVSNSAAEELGALIEARVKEISAEAQKLSRHAGRRTVMRRDIKLAAKHEGL